VQSYADISIKTLTSTPVLVILAAAVLAALAAWSYYRTNPPVAVVLRAVLWFLRTLALGVVVLVLMEPVVHLVQSIERRPRVSLLVDYSSSMDRQEEESSRLQRIDSLLSGPAYRSLAEKVDISRFYFADGLSSDSDKIARDKTALGDALVRLDGEQIREPADYWLLFSDGKSNSGQDPVAAASGVSPILTIDVATDAGAFDLRLVDVQAPPVLYAGRSTEIKARIQWHKAGERRAVVELKEGNRILDRQEVDVGEDGGFGDLELDYVPSEPGQHLLEIDILPQEGEENEDNNSRAVSVDVLKSRLEVLLVSEHPDYEVGFLRRHLLASDRYDVELIATGNKAGNVGGTVPRNQTELNRFDVIILDDPSPKSLAPLQPTLKSYLEDRGGALWVMMGERFASQSRNAWFTDLLPFFPSGRPGARYVSFQAEPSESDLFHPALRLADDRASIRERWANLPPFAFIVPCDSVDPQASVLATARVISERARLPVLGQKRIGPGKVLAAATGPFWRWKFVSLGLGEDPGGYDSFVDGILSWLTVSDEFAPVRISSDKEVYTRGEEVEFNGFAFDLGFRPIPGASGSVTLRDSSGSEQYAADLLEIGEGRYRAGFDRLPPGNYSFEAALEKDGRELRRQEGRIRVESFTLEDFDQSGDPQLLRAVAGRSGGGYFSFRDFDRAVAALPIETLVEQRETEFTLFHRSWLLIVFIAALCLEWFIRKMNHLL
jgi:hypothetical protein